MRRKPTGLSRPLGNSRRRPLLNAGYPCSQAVTERNACRCLLLASLDRDPDRSRSVCSGRDSLLVMTRVLITGMSGTGKSTALADLARRGHRVVDADLPAWSIEVTSPGASGAEQLWREDAMDALLAQHVTGWLFVAGCASNQGSFYDRFDAVVLLSVPREVMLQRIARRSTKPFGKGAHEQQRILADLEAVEPLLRATSTVEIVTTILVAEIVDALESVARQAEGGSPSRFTRF